MLKPIIEHLGGHWREKIQKFVFYTNVEDVLFDAIENGVDVTDRYRYQELTQFYPTPKKVAQRVIELAEISDKMSVLEPSAGTGALLDEITKKVCVIGVEPLAENSAVLLKKGYPHITCTFEAFARDTDLKVDRVVMNPPFSGQRDAIHTMMAYNLLKTGGILTAIVSENSLYYQTETSEKFRKFLERVNAVIEPIPPNSFEESGTTIETVIVKIVK
jgi:predicted RNA methylase